MSAKAELFNRLKYLNSAVELEPLIDDGILPSDHNGVANLLRKGLGIVAFNILEDYIKNRTKEALLYVSHSGVSFTRLTDSLQEASTLGAIRALAFHANIHKKDGNDWKLLIQDEALKIHSTKKPTYALSNYSLVSSRPNIGANEVSDLLRSFGISDGWNKLKIVSDSIGGGLPDLQQSYKNIAERRHNSAHKADYDYDYRWLENIRNEIIAIAVSLDVLLSARCRQISADLSKAIKSHDINNGLNFRFLEKSGSEYRETSVIGGRARKIWSLLDDAVNGIKPNLISKKEFLIILDDSRRINDWYES